MSETNTAERLEAAQARLLNVQTELERAITEARTLLIEIADEVRQGGIKVRRREFYARTEKEVAAIFQVGAATIARMRKVGEIPYVRFGTLVRYTDEHIEAIAKVREKMPRAKSRHAAKRGAASNLPNDLNEGTGLP